MIEQLKRLSRYCGNVHRPGDRPDIFLFATPRGGSTWFMEMIGSQLGVKYCAEPFNVRRPEIAKSLGITNFAELYAENAHEKFQPYLGKLRNNENRFLNPTPFRKNHRWKTNRMVFKVIHAGMDRVEWFEDTYNAQVLHVLRHPIPVSLSRKSFPLLESFENCDLRSRFSTEQLRLADEIRESGDHLEKGVVAWCLHNAIPLWERRDSWMVVTYEQAVLEPEIVIKALCKKLSFDEPDKMSRCASEASRVTNQSTEERKRLLADPSRRKELISSWQRHVNGSKERKLMEILGVFGLSVYNEGGLLPSKSYWIGE